MNLSTEQSANENPLERAIRLAGGQSALAAKITVLGKPCTQQTISWWLTRRGGAVTSEYVRYVAAAVDGDVSEQELRPDVFGPVPARAA